MTHRNGRYNRGVEALTKDDIYQWNPWRAPGSAPVYDPCGMAGGSPEWTSTQLSFIDTVNNKQGESTTRTTRTVNALNDYGVEYLSSTRHPRAASSPPISFVFFLVRIFVSPAWHSAVYFGVFFPFHHLSTLLASPF